MKTVLIDIGHANGSGARGNGLEEHAVNVKIAKLLKNTLATRGIQSVVIDFPDKSNGDDLTATAREANKYNADLGVSLHSDCSDNNTAHGGHVCYYSKTGKVIADCIAKFIGDLLPGRAEKVVYRNNLYILKNTRAPWVLVEGGFISNKADSAVMSNHPEAIANAIADGIELYFKK